MSVYDFKGDGGAVVAGLTFVDGNTWFVKMTGDGAVAAARPDFLRIVESSAVTRRINPCCCARSSR